MNPGLPQSRPPHDPESLRLRFRGTDRRPIRGSAMAAFRDEEDGLTLTRVDLLDESAGGLGLRSPVEVRVGTRFALYARHLPVIREAGVVARCTADGDSFRIGLRCDRLEAA